MYEGGKSVTRVTANGEEAHAEIERNEKDISSTILGISYVLGTAVHFIGKVTVHTRVDNRLLLAIQREVANSLKTLLLTSSARSTCFAWLVKSV